MRTLPHLLIHMLFVYIHVCPSTLLFVMIHSLNLLSYSYLHSSSSSQLLADSSSAWTKIWSRACEDTVERRASGGSNENWMFLLLVFCFNSEVMNTRGFLCSKRTKSHSMSATIFPTTLQCLALCTVYVRALVRSVNCPTALPEYHFMLICNTAWAAYCVIHPVVC